MMNVNIGRILNQRFECPECEATDNWGAGARAMSRKASTIQGFSCHHCGAEIVVKVTRTAACSKARGQVAQKEYHVLYELQTAFPQSGQFGSLVPLGYLEFNGYGAMITRKFDGVDMVRYASRLNADEIRGLFRPAGVLLRKLHDSCPKGYQPRTLGVEDKVTYLAQTYGVELRRDPAMRTILDQFEEAATRISAIALRATWSHGDFKPENVLCNGHKYVILDTQLEVYGAFVYDLASFLDHMLIAGESIRGSSIRHQYPQAEEEFLAGYGDVTQEELAALRWAQLYFMLCYWGTHRLGGPVAAIYANWRIRPLAQKLAAEL